MGKHILILEGDGIGPEIVTQALRVLEVLKNEGMKMEFTEATLPLMWSGVCNCRIVFRITTETPSKTPLKNIAKTEIQKISDNPKIIIQIPNMKIAPNNFIPAFLFKEI